MKFVMSYSCGKDSTFALHKLIEAGHEPVGLLVMVNEVLNRSWFHGADCQMLNKISKAMEIPLLLCPSQGEDYHTVFEDGLRRAKELGAQMAGFGDIDIENNRKWCEERCEAVGIESVFPLWQQGREEIVSGLIHAGYTCIIKNINHKLLPRELLGRILDEETVGIMKQHGIDVCGENGEYHTIAVNGPVFKHDLEYHTGEILDFDDRSVIEIW